MAVESDFVRRATTAHDAVFKFSDWRSATVDLAKKQHYIQTPLGWRRYFWAWNPKPTEVLATQIQATAADLLKWSTAALVAKLPEPWELILSTHDETVLHVPASDAGAARDLLVSTMQAPVPWLDGLSFRVEAKVGETWRDV